MSGTFDVQIAKEGNALHAAGDGEAGVNLIAAGIGLEGSRRRLSLLVSKSAMLLGVGDGGSKKDGESEAAD